MKGFTLFEVLIVLGLVSLIGVFIFFSITNYRQRQDLDLATQALATFLRETQQKAVSQESGTDWRVYLENKTNTNDFYEVAGGSPMATTTRVALRGSLEFADPAAGQAKTIIFRQATGLPNAAATIVIQLKNDATINKTIAIKTNGAIEF